MAKTKGKPPREHFLPAFLTSDDRHTIIAGVIITGITSLVCVLAIFFLSRPASINLYVDAPGYDQDASTPVIVHVQSTDDAEVDFYHALDANRDQSFNAATGSYELSFISPINADGALYEVALPEEIFVAEHEASACSLNFIPRAADSVSEQDLVEVLDQIKAATEQGDDTLKDNAGKTILVQAVANASAAPQADKAALESYRP